MIGRFVVAKHKAKWWDRGQAYIPHDVVAAREAFAEAVRSNDIDAARKARVRGRVGSQIRLWSDALRPFWK